MKFRLICYLVAYILALGVSILLYFKKPANDPGRNVSTKVAKKYNPIPVITKRNLPELVESTDKDINASSGSSNKVSRISVRVYDATGNEIPRNEFNVYLFTTKRQNHSREDVPYELCRILVVPDEDTRYAISYKDAWINKKDVAEDIVLYQGAVINAQITDMHGNSVKNVEFWLEVTLPFISTEVNGGFTFVDNSSITDSFGESFERKEENYTPRRICIGKYFKATGKYFEAKNGFFTFNNIPIGTMVNIKITKAYDNDMVYYERFLHVNNVEINLMIPLPYDTEFLEGKR